MDRIVKLDFLSNSVIFTKRISKRSGPMKGLEKKFKKQMDAAQLAAMLREIADEL